MLTEVEWNILMKDLWQGKKSLTEEEEKMFPQAMEKVLAMKEAYWMGTGELTEAETLQWEKLQEEIDRQSEEAEKKHEALVEKALQTRESPQVEGRWAQIRRGFLQWYSPEEWLNLVESGEATMYLKRIEEETEKRYQRMYRHEEEMQILGRSLSRLEEIQTSNEIEAMLRELLTAELSR